MSELKAYKGDIYIPVYGSIADAKVYLKREADKVIAHHKYKRCLAMAKWCEDKVDAIKNGYIVSSIESQHGVMTTCPPECNPKFSHYSRWQKRWLKIAERFKEAK